MGDTQSNPNIPREMFDRLRSINDQVAEYTDKVEWHTTDETSYVVDKNCIYLVYDLEIDEMVLQALHCLCFCMTLERGHGKMWKRLISTHLSDAVKKGLVERRTIDIV